MTKEQTVPKWFEGTVYDEGEVVMNRFSGAECKLNALELSIYDMIMGAQLAIDLKYNGDMLDPKTAYFQREMRKGLDWFRENNAEAYMILLD
tara:strand:+ start:981 stop:1256 length:276 start_codon:yes stop_codon:yes gene_type:complete